MHCHISVTNHVLCCNASTEFTATGLVSVNDKFTPILYTQRYVVCNRFIIYTTFFWSFGRSWSLEAYITKLTLTVALTLTNTVTIESSYRLFVVQVF